MILPPGGGCGWMDDSMRSSIDPPAGKKAAGLVPAPPLGAGAGEAAAAGEGGASSRGPNLFRSVGAMPPFSLQRFLATCTPTVRSQIPMSSV
eukprot:scaffold227194_cov19-Tisochrysis_lutea.AAC.1